MVVPERKSFAALQGHSNWFVLVVAVFITCLVTANITAAKLIEVSSLVLPAGIVVFPVTYILGDILTEVYGYSQARRVIWLGFLCNLLAVVAIYLGRILPPAEFWDGQAAYERILGYTPRLLAASFVAYLVGEFTNSFVLARMKLLTRGKRLWTRTIASTLLGQAFDSLIFMSVAYLGAIPTGGLVSAIVTQWLAKSLYEAMATPLTYLAVGFLKKTEGLDIFDDQTRFSPIRLRD